MRAKRGNLIDGIAIPDRSRGQAQLRLLAMTVSIMKNIFKLTLLIFVLSIFYPFTQVKAAGAALFLSPSSGTYELGESFTVKAMVNSGGGVGINASEGSIKFDTDMLTFVSISKAGSVFSLWTGEPTSSGGSVSYGGGSPRGSEYTGAAGTMFSVKFKAKKLGTAKVSFSSGKAIEAGPPFEDIVSSLGSASFVIEEPEKEESKPEPEKPEPEEKPEPKKRPKREEQKEEEKSTGALPPSPRVESVTHEEEDVWYRNNEPEFNWQTLNDLTGISFSITDDASSDPGPTSDGIVDVNKFQKQEDGEHYFHIKFQNKNGWSGEIAHRKFLVDVTSPSSFSIKVDNDGDETNPTPRLMFDVVDVASGIDFYNIKIDNTTEKVSAKGIVNGAYQLNILSPGDHNANIEVYDRAGNVASSSINFIVEALKKPVITSIPSEINQKEELVIRGESFYSQVTIKISLSRAGDEEPQVFITKTDDAGNWSYFHKGELEKGVYEVTAKVVDDRGAESYDSSAKILTVVFPAVIETYCKLIILLLVAIVLGLIFYIFYIKRRFEIEKLRIKTETVEVKDKLRKIFAALREEIDELIEIADKKPGLSESERRVKEKMQESLDISEEFISKEIEDVEKEIKLKKKKVK